MPRSRYTAEEKLAILEEFKHSGLGAGRFERQHGLSEHSLERWQARYEHDGLKGLRGSQAE